MGQVLKIAYKDGRITKRYIDNIHDMTILIGEHPIKRIDIYHADNQTESTTTLEASQVPLKASSTEETTTLTETTTPTDET